MREIDPHVALLELASRACRGSLSAAVHALWPVLNPGVPLIWSRGLEAVCLHLEAVTRREIRRLLINIAPGTGKSTIISTIWQVWEWVQYPERRWICATHASNLSLRQNVQRLALIRHPLYQRLFRPTWTLVKGRQGKREFWNSANGMMMATSVGARDFLGSHADTQAIDDPIDAERALEPRYLEDCSDWFFKRMITRVRDPLSSAFVLLMQRLARGDLSDQWIKWGVDAHLSLPAIYDPALDVGATGLGWSDWREEGDLLLPGRHTREQLEEARYDMGTPAFMSQYQQTPSEDGLQMFRPEWWVRHEQAPSHAERWVGSVDMAVSGTKRSDYSVAQVWCQVDDVAYLVDQERIRAAWPGPRGAILALARRHPKCKAWRVEMKSIGPAILHDLRSEGIRGVVGVPAKDPKPVRIGTMAPFAEFGQISIPTSDSASWARDFIREATEYPSTAHDDQMDAAAMAIAYLAPTLRQARKARHDLMGRPYASRPGPVSSPVASTRPRRTSRF